MCSANVQCRLIPLFIQFKEVYDNVSTRTFTSSTQARKSMPETLEDVLRAIELEKMRSMDETRSQVDRRQSMQVRAGVARTAAAVGGGMTTAARTPPPAAFMRLLAAVGFFVPARFRG